MNYTIEKIAWIDCIFAPMNDVNSITVRIMCKAWSNNETEEQWWIAHCLEHMFFKGWERYKTQKDVAETLDSIGAVYNAFTGNNTVEYFVKCAPNFIEKSLDVLADMMMNARFDVDELEKEKWVIIQEMKMYEDNPMSLVSEKQRLRYFGNNSFGRPVIWNEKTVSSFTPQDLRDYKDSLYTKDNLIIVIAGKWAENEEIRRLIEKYFVWMNEKRTVDSPVFPNNLPDKHESFFKKWTEQNHLIIAAPGFLWTDDRRYAAKVLASILWWNMSSRLFQNIRTKEWLCYYISSYHNAGPECWTFGIRAWMDKERFEFWLKRIREEVDDYVKNGATQEEFDKSIWYLQWHTQMWIDSPEEMACFLGDQYLVYNKIDTLEEILEEYKKLTLNDVNQLCWMLDLKNCYTYHIE